jgi:hypothetical protein
LEYGAQGNKAGKVQIKDLGVRTRRSFRNSATWRSSGLNLREQHSRELKTISVEVRQDLTANTYDKAIDLAEVLHNPRTHLANRLRIRTKP